MLPAHKYQPDIATNQLTPPLALYGITSTCMLCLPAAAAAAAAHVSPAASVKPWNMPAQLQPLLSAWLEKQMSGFTVWVDRQLQHEDWKPLGLEQVWLPDVLCSLSIAAMCR
jgi:hypothetical protein